MSVRVEHGDCREILGNMEPDSVQCCITSPPYFGLRDYKLKPLVWGGKVDCGHEWGCKRRVKRSGGTQASTLGEASGGHAISDAARVASIERSFHEGSLGQFCRYCGAWRGQLGLEPTPELYVAHIVECFRAVKRVLRADGVLWLNMGDSFSAKSTHHGGNKLGPLDSKASLKNVKGRKCLWQDSLKPKDLMLMPFEVAKALRADGWWLRSDIIWSKPNPMPESVTDRPTQAHEHVFLFAKSARYFYAAEAVKEATERPVGSRENVEKGVFQGKTCIDPPREEAFRAIRDTRNLRNVWEIATAPYPDAHFATFPPKLVEPCIKAGSHKGDTILDPFAGAGTVGLVADRLGRNAILIDQSQEYCEMAQKRVQADGGMFAETFP